MSSLTDRVAYLKGLAEGMEIGEDSKMGKLITAMIDVLGDTAEAFQQLKEEFEELDEYVESIDDDLTEIEETLFDDDDDDNDDDYDDDLIECECPKCSETVYLDADGFDLTKEHVCPKCDAALFDDGDDEDDD